MEVKKRYKVLWLDDKHEEMNGFKLQARMEGIDIVSYKSADGLDELEQNYLFYDGVILDAKFFEHETDSAGTESIKALAKAKDRLARLPKKIAYFVLTGQAELHNDQTFNTLFPNYYRKGNDNDINDLFSILKREADQQIETQVRHDYKRVFELCDEKYLGKSAQKPLMLILKNIHEPSSSFDDELYFTQIRIILELMFRAANKVGLLHDKCINAGKVNLSESSSFLSGLPTKHLGVLCRKSHFNAMISSSVKSILFVTGAASHTVDPEIKNNINLTEYRSIINTPYLLYSLTFQLIDILIWFKNYSESNSDIEINKSFWMSKDENLDEWMHGSIVSLHLKGFAFFKPDHWGENTYIHPNIVAENNLANGDKVSVQIEDYEDNRTHEIKTKVIALKKREN